MKHSKASKTSSESVLLKFDMKVRCIEGETIYLANVNSTVLSGEDPNPSIVVSGAAAVINGSWVEQLVVGGLVGVVYQLWIAVRTTLGNVYIDTMSLAILPNLDIRITDAGDVRTTDSGDRRIVDV